MSDAPAKKPRQRKTLNRHLANSLIRRLRLLLGTNSTRHPGKLGCRWKMSWVSSLADFLALGGTLAVARTRFEKAKKG